IVLALVALGIWTAVYNLFLKPPEAAPIQTTFAERRPFSMSIQGGGQVKATKTEAITVKAKGELLELFVSEGDKVEVGDPLFRVDDSAVKEQITDGEDDLLALQEELSKIYEKIANLSITAPFKGKVLDVKIKEGASVTDGMQVATMVDDSKMLLVQYFSYAYENDIHIGQTADISIPATMSVISGKVSDIEMIRKVTAEGTVLFEVTLVVSNPGALGKGMAATAVLKGADGADITPAEEGTLEYYREEAITSEAAGKVVTLNMRDYYEFGSGALLCVLEGASYDDQITAQNKKIQEKQTALDELYKQLDAFNATAPIAGTVTSVAASVGQTIDAAATVLTISDTSAMILEVQIDERDINNVKAGMPVTLTQDTAEGQQFFMGTVDTVSLQGNYDWGYAYFPATIRIEGGEGLFAGSSLNFEIIVTEKDDCLLVPTQAVQYLEEGTCVFVRAEAPPAGAVEDVAGVAPEGFFIVPVETGVGDSSSVEILGGLEDGAEVFLQPGGSQDQFGGMHGGAIMVG
ncbi:HlyD family efflux transporter periplasmic adaptor subunit, partial [Oscillospiraceae bacterium OttesenSCG-928-F05]|nr:HlyD family efflux transporter periplasmic adaptor subunit [Oscillospiraceae bacterium OttesenSCG-928-F05]